MLVPQ